MCAPDNLRAFPRLREHPLGEEREIEIVAVEVVEDDSSRIYVPDFVQKLSCGTHGAVALAVEGTGEKVMDSGVHRSADADMAHPQAAQGRGHTASACREDYVESFMQGFESVAEGGGAQAAAFSCSGNYQTVHHRM